MTKQSVLRGLLSFLAILLMMPLGHAFVILLGKHLEGSALAISAILLGLAGIIIAITGNRLRSEAMQVLTGSFGAILFWGAWVEFIYISYGQSLQVPPLMEGDTVLTKPEYLMMPTSIPFAVLAFIMYIYLAETRWGLILLFRKWLRINPDNVARHVVNSVRAFIDLLLLIWWAYLILLVEFDRGFLGERHPVTMIFATICLVCGLILLIRSLKAPTWASGLRQAIVTVCVLWTYIEVMIKLKMFTEIWIYPERYFVEMIMLLVAMVSTLFIIAYMGHKGIKKHGKR